jgi:hypothetical protein
LNLSKGKAFKFHDVGALPASDSETFLIRGNFYESVSRNRPLRTAEKTRRAATQAL